MRVAVVAHAGKTVGGGLVELRRVLEREGIADPLWFEVPKSRKAPKRVKRALEEGAELVFAWGGDGTVQRCLDVLAGTGVPLAVVPAGTANLFATNLGVPGDIEGAVEAGLRGARRTIDVGRLNGERFGVMAGTGLDAAMIRDADAGLKDRVGRIAYVGPGARTMAQTPFEAKIRVDGSTWFDDTTSCILVGNVGRLFGGVAAFDDARPDDGMLELGVVTAESAVEWARTLARTAVGTTARSPFAQVTRARTIDVTLDRKVLYELDGGDREKVTKRAIEVEPGAIEVCVPGASCAGPRGPSRDVGADGRRRPGDTPRPPRAPHRWPPTSRPSAPVCTSRRRPIRRRLRPPARSAVVDPRLDDAGDPPRTTRHARQHDEPVGQRASVLEQRELLRGGRPPQLVDHADRLVGDVGRLEVLLPERETGVTGK
jgi:YegS/Rv2252/BmrU family lipid kinase